MKNHTVGAPLWWGADLMKNYFCWHLAEEAHACPPPQKEAGGWHCSHSAVPVRSAHFVFPGKSVTSIDSDVASSPERAGGHGEEPKHTIRAFPGRVSSLQSQVLIAHPRTITRYCKQKHSLRPGNPTPTVQSQENTSAQIRALPPQSTEKGHWGLQRLR